MQIKNEKHDFHFQLVQQTLSKAFHRVGANQGTAIWGCWRKAGKGDRNTDHMTPGSLQLHILKNKVSGGGGKFLCDWMSWNMELSSMSTLFSS